MCTDIKNREKKKKEKEKKKKRKKERKRKEKRRRKNRQERKKRRKRKESSSRYLCQPALEGHLAELGGLADLVLQGLVKLAPTLPQPDLDDVDRVHLHVAPVAQQLAPGVPPAGRQARAGPGAGAGGPVPPAGLCTLHYKTDTTATSSVQDVGLCTLHYKTDTTATSSVQDVGLCTLHYKQTGLLHLAFKMRDCVHYITKQTGLLHLAFKKTNQIENTQEVKNERFLISTRQNNVNFQHTSAKCFYPIRVLYLSICPFVALLKATYT